MVPHQVYLEHILAPLYGPEHNRTLADSDFLSVATPMRRLEEKGQAIFKNAQKDYKDFMMVSANPILRLILPKMEAGLSANTVAQPQGIILMLAVLNM